MDKDLKQLKMRLRSKVPAFARAVAPLYAILDWKWYLVGTTASIPNNHTHTDFRIPTTADIEESLYSKIEEMKPGVTNIQSGGLGIEIEYIENGTEKIIAHATLYFQHGEIVKV